MTYLGLCFFKTPVRTVMECSHVICLTTESWIRLSFEEGANMQQHWNVYFSIFISFYIFLLCKT